MPTADDLFADLPEVPKERGIRERMGAGWTGGFGEPLFGTQREWTRHFGPGLAQFHPLVAPVDVALRAPLGAVGALAGLGAGAGEKAGLAKAEADRLQRDLAIAGQGLMTEPVMGLAAARAPLELQGLAREARRMPEPVREPPPPLALPPPRPAPAVEAGPPLPDVIRLPS